MSFIYYTFGFISLIASLIVVSALNPIHRIGYLILVFMIGAFIFMLLDFYFLGQVYIIVYVGAIAILFLFIIMMVECNTPTELKNIQNNLDNSLSINLTLPLNNCGGETITVSPIPFKGITPIKFYSSVKLNGLPLLAENTNLVNYSIFDCTFFNKNSNFTPVSHNTLSLQVKRKNTNKITIKGKEYLIDGYNFLTVLVFWPFLRLDDNEGVRDEMMVWDVQDIQWEQFDIPGVNGGVSEWIVSNVTGYINEIQLQQFDTYFYPVWAIEFLSMTDLQTLGVMVYIAYPYAQIQIGLTLWTVMIGIISICSPSHE